MKKKLILGGLQLAVLPLVSLVLFNSCNNVEGVKSGSTGNQQETGTPTVNNTIKEETPAEKPDSHSFTDLGLPSGTLWATCNVGAESPEESGDFFAWGETAPKATYAPDNYSVKNVYGFNKYNGVPDYGKVDKLFTLSLEDDAASANWGDGWRTPTVNDFEELLNENLCSWTYVDNTNSAGETVKGCRVTSKANGNSVFLPFAGSNSGAYLGTNGLYMSSSLFDKVNNCPSSQAYYLNISKNGGYTNSVDRSDGLTVRPVRNSVPATASSHNYVDLGFPSGTLWATCNVGADAPADYGQHFAWGETSAKKSYGWDSYKLWSRATLASEDDAASANWGSNWCVPTEEQMFELVDECEWAWVDSTNSAGKPFNGYKVISKANGKSIFLPSTGYRCGSELNDKGNSYYWTASIRIGEPATATSYQMTSEPSAYYCPRYQGLAVRPVRAQKK